MDEYIKSLLTQISESYNFLKERRDEPGDIEIIKVHLGKIQGFVKVLCNKIEDLNYSSDNYLGLLKLGKSYLQNYDFNKVIEAYEIYSEDILRIKNIRISILSSLEENKFIFKIQSMLRDLDS